MRRRQFLAALPLLAGLPARAADAKLPVIATFSILADMVRRVGGKKVAVVSLVPVDGDAHEYQLTPEDLRHVRDAAVLVENGLGLEGWMSRLPEAAGFHGVRITAGKDVASRQMSQDGRMVADPHAWQDPRNGVLYVRAIAKGLALAMPSATAEIDRLASAYIAEIVRSGIQAVPQGQWEAAGALGLSPGVVLTRIILPQSLRVIIPPMTSQYLNITKNTSLAVAIGYQDIVSISQTTLNQTGQAIEGVGIVMAVFLSISLSISLFMNWYNKRIALTER